MMNELNTEMPDQDSPLPHEHVEDQTLHPEHPPSHTRVQEHDSGHSHSRAHSSLNWLAQLFHWHGHSHQQREITTDQAIIDNKKGVRVLWISLAILLATSLLQLFVVWLSGSVALLADTFHNIGDGLNSIPLLIALYLARRAATRRYTYGFGKAEDVAGIFIVISIALSAIIVFWESIQRFIDPEPMTNLVWVAAAAIIGFFGNELVAVFEIRTGRKIGSAALVTDGLHARVDGLTSLSVLLAAGGTWLGFPILDPIIGILIGITILFITRDAILAIWYRLMDAIEPEYLDQAEMLVKRQSQIRELRRLRMRWVGNRLHAEIVVAVDPLLTTAQSHEIAEEVRHVLFHHFPTLSEVMVHVDPWPQGSTNYHRLTESHESLPTRLQGGRS